MLDGLEKALDSTENSLEIRLLQFYIIVQLFWAIFNTIFSMATGMPKQTIMIFLALSIGIPLYLSIGHFTKQGIIYSRAYFVLTFFIMPITWYCVGGNRGSGNILFISELQLFTMCMRGKRQKIYIALSIAMTTILMMFSGRFPDKIPLALEPRQLQIGGMGLGLSTSALIVLLLIKQKQEYVKERERVITSEKELKRSNQLQKNFLANMSHEIRSPLGIVLGFNSLISETDDIKQIYEYSTNIEKAGKTLQTVINDILDYSKIESGKLDIVCADYSFNELVEEISADIGLKCEGKGLSFVVEKDSTIPDFLYGDNIRIKQCLFNLLTNAVKYTDEGTVSFIIDNAGRNPDGKVGIKLKIVDTGRGISEEEVPKLFTSFQRLDEGHNRGIEGTGLGLAITKNLLDAMGGTISVESSLGQGTTVTVYLEQPLGKPVGNVVIKPQVVIPVAGTKIMVVDDTPMNLSLVEKMLSKGNYKVVTINSGKKCLEAIMEDKYDLILLDHMMPEMNGVEVFEHMKENPGMNADTPVVMLTANAMMGAEQEYTKMGFNGYLSKPIDQKKLIAMITELTTNR